MARQTDVERRQTYIIIMVFCLIMVAFSDEDRRKEESAAKRLRMRASPESVVSLPTDVALDTFHKRLNTTTTSLTEALVTNVYLGQYGKVIDSAESIGLTSFNKHASQIWAIGQYVTDGDTMDSLNASTEFKASTDPNIAIVQGSQSLSDAAVHTESTLDRSLRWTLDNSLKTTLEGTFRIRGTLWNKEDPVALHGLYISQHDRITLFSMNKYSKEKKFALGLETPLPENVIVSANWSDKISSPQGSEGQLLRGRFGGANGLAFGEPVVSTTDDSMRTPVMWPMASEEYKHELFPGCSHPIRFDLTLSYDESASTTKRRPVSFTGIGICSNATLMFEIPETKSLLLDIEYATKASAIISLFSIFETARLGQLLTHLGPLRLGVMSDLGPLSMATFGWIALTDTYLLELFLSLSNNVGGDGWWVTAAVLKGLQALFTYIPIMILILFGRSRLLAEPNDEITRNLSRCMSRSQLTWFSVILTMELLRPKFPLILALAWVSFWVPQIYCTATLNLALPVPMKDLVTISMFRAAWPVFAMSTTILDTFAAMDKFGSHSDAPVFNPAGALLVIGWIGFQLLIIQLQMKRGSQFFVPRFMLPKRFDYFAGRDKVKEGEECVVCMQNVDKDEAVITPCSHVFHEACLSPWLAMKRSCPTCRTALPQMTIEK